MKKVLLPLSLFFIILLPSIIYTQSNPFDRAKEIAELYGKEEGFSKMYYARFGSTTTLAVVYDLPSGDVSII